MCVMFLVENGSGFCCAAVAPSVKPNRVTRLADRVDTYRSSTLIPCARTIVDKLHEK